MARLGQVDSRRMLLAAIMLTCVAGLLPVYAQEEILSVLGDAAGGPGQDYGAAAASGFFNDDDELDLAVGAPYHMLHGGAVFVLCGPFVNGVPGSTITFPQLPADSGNFGSSLSFADSYTIDPVLGVRPTCVVGAPYANNQRGRVVDYAQLSQSLEEDVLSFSIGITDYLDTADHAGQVVSSCDFNGDTYADVIVGTDHHISDALTGKVFVFFGGPNKDDRFDVIIRPTYQRVGGWSQFGGVVAGVRDITGDNCGDLIIGDADRGAVYIVFGRPLEKGHDDPPFEILISGSGGEALVKTVPIDGIVQAAGGGDLTGDTVADIVLATRTSSTGTVYVCPGPITVSGPLSIHATIDGPATFGEQLDLRGNVDGDEFNDLIIGGRRVTTYGQSTGRVSIVLGGPRLLQGAVVHCPWNAITTRSVWQLVPPGLENGAEFGSSVGYLGDQDGDGKDEIFVGAPAAGTPTGQPGELFGFNLSESAIDIAAEAAPITAGPTCGVSNLLAVHVESPVAIDVFADVSSLGGGSALVELFDSGPPGDAVANDDIYSAYIAGTIVDTNTQTVEVFARGQAASGGFAIKNVQVPVNPSPLVAPIAECPLSKSSPALPLLAVRVSPCGGAPTRVTLDDPTGFYWNLPDLTDQGPPGDLVANDGIWSYSGSEAAIILPPPGFYDFSYVVYYPDSILTGTVKFQVIEPTVVSYVNKSGGTLLNYTGQPYSSVAIDFTPGPGPKDLFISMLDDRGALYKCRFVSSAGVPEFEVGGPEDTGGSLPPTGLLGLAVADFNNDGREDLFAAAQSSARLYRAVASGDPVLQDVTSPLIPSSAFANSLTGAWGDYDRDGRLDLFVGCGVVTGEPGIDFGTPANGILLRNDTRSGGGFVDVSASTGIGDLAQYAVTATWGDINGDKFPDLFVGDASESGTASRLFRNGKDGGFADEGNTRFGGNLNSVVGACFGDVDADGDLDLTVATRTGAAIRINTSAGTYTSIVPVGTATTVSGVNVFDFDYNGVQDVLLLSADSASTPRLFRGASSGGNLSFADVTSAVGLNWAGKTGGSVLSDFNGDGDLDLYLGRAVAQSAHFFTAAGLDPADDAYTDNWQQVQLVSNIDVPNSYRGVGAKVTVTQGATSFVRVVDGGSGRGGQSDSILEFGLPTSAAVSNIQVEWPNGYVQNHANPSTPFVTITDDTKLFTITRISGGYQTVPCTDLSRWTFSWTTSVGTNPALDKVVYKIGDSEVFNGGTEVAATDAGVIHSSFAKSIGYEHNLSFVAPCVLGQTIYFKVISKGYGEVAGETKNFTITVCTPCLPNQQ